MSAELILHHTYDTWEGLPVDRSPYGLSSGRAVGAAHLPDGAEPGSGALDLGTAPDHRIAVPVSRAWQDLGAVSAELLVRFDGTPGREDRDLIDADGSFRFGIATQVVGDAGIGIPRTRQVGHLRVVDPNAHLGWVDVWTTAAIPLGRWTRLGFTHDGAGNLTITIDGQVRARKQTGAPLLPVGPRGISIGHRWSGPIDNRRLAVDEVKVWRRDPDRVHKVFVARPMSPRAADCLEQASSAVRAHWAADPQFGAEQAGRALEVADMLTRKAATSGAAEEWQRLHERYVELWTSGAIDTDAMEGLLREAVTWWREKGGDPERDADLQGTIGGMVPPPGGIDLTCDPALAGFLARLERAVRG